MKNVIDFQVWNDEGIISHTLKMQTNLLERIICGFRMERPNYNDIKKFRLSVYPASGRTFLYYANERLGEIKTEYQMDEKLMFNIIIKFIPI